MMKLNFDAPINSLSLGNVSINFLRELHKRDIDVSLFSPSPSIDIKAYDKLDEEFVRWMQSISVFNMKDFSNDTPTLKVWHIKDSEKQLGHNQYLYTFYELDSPTETEVNTVKAQKHVFFSSSESAQLFKDKGCTNVSYVPLGFDPDIKSAVSKGLKEDVIHFSLIGKFEKRKNTQAILYVWGKKFGDDPKYALTCLIDNPFMKEEDVIKAASAAFGGKKPKNVNFLPRLETNSEVNALMASSDINLSGISNGEGWNLPAFNSAALGKWSIVSDCSAHKDWATSKNSILIPIKSKQPCYDNIFFKEGLNYNQGEYYLCNQKLVEKAMDEAVKLAKKPNAEGMSLQTQFTYEKSMDQILSKIFNDK